MSFFKLLVKFFSVASIVAVFSQPAFSQADPAVKHLLKKLDSQTIFEKASIGTPQSVLVSLDVAADMELIIRKHQTLKAARNGAITADEPIKLTESEETALIADKKRKLDQIKGEVFPNKANGRARVVEDFSHSPILRILITDVDALIELLKNPRVKSISTIPNLAPTGTNNLQLIGQPITAAAGKTGANTRMVIMDTGLFNQNSSELSGKIVDAIEWNWDTGEQVPLCSFFGCSYGGATFHGQNVASIAALVAPRAKISFLRAVGSSLDLVRSLNWVLANYQRSPAVVVVNMSLSLTYNGGVNPEEGGYIPVYSSSCAIANTAISNQITEVSSHNILVVAASGNGSNANSISAPACMPNVVAVGAVTDSPSVTTCSSPLAVDQIACFSNGGSQVKILAPGVSISDSTSGGETFSGTSQAAPHVSGAIAVLRGTNAFPGEINSKTLERITTTGNLVLDSRNNMYFPRLRLDKASNSGTVGINPPNCRRDPRLCY
jgi:hypothetical protein